MECKPPALHRQPKSGSLGIPGAMSKGSWSCSSLRAVSIALATELWGKVPALAWGWAGGPGSKMNLQLVAQSREEQGQWLAGRELLVRVCKQQDTGNVLMLLGGKMSWDMWDGLVPWEGGGALGQKWVEKLRLPWNGGKCARPGGRGLGGLKT
ncbi:hypothetical protein DUI87_28589 [Hirundo rustica rustica]|uniref:Uncharacterized protein n=1 Tax=Hirundo rustica rustica TaxID=333673 RepID=A0A3M0J229_HIRRU|nr:hypothetical protein DUI87_28589 [Hirundo rustica rustica]